MSQQITYTQSNGAVSTSCAFGSNPAKGSLLVILTGAWSSPVMPSSLSDTLGTVFYQMGTTAGGSSATAVYAGLTTATGANTVSTTGFGGTSKIIIIYEFAVPPNLLVGGYNGWYDGGAALTSSTLFIPSIQGAWNTATETMVVGQLWNQTNVVKKTNSGLTQPANAQVADSGEGDGMVSGYVDTVGTVVQASTVGDGTWDISGINYINTMVVLVALTPPAGGGGTVGHAFVM